MGFIQGNTMSPQKIPFWKSYEQLFLGLIIEEVRFLADLKIAKNIFLNIILN